MVKIARVQARMLALVLTDDKKTAAREYAPLMSELMAAEDEADVGFAALHSRDTGDALESYWRNMYCACLVKGYHIAQLLVNLMTHYPPCPTPLARLEAQRNYCLERVRSAAEEIVDSAPKNLSRNVTNKDQSPKALFDALKLVWPLTAVYVCQSTTPEQTASAELLLFYVGKELGIRQALKSYSGRPSSGIPEAALSPRGLRQPEDP
jgi:hypothetical protein